MSRTSAPWPTLSRKLVAILRGITPAEAPAIVAALVEAGFEAVEVPLNSPEPFASIRAARAVAPAEVLVGAGTVLSVEDVDRVAEAGGGLIVSPNVDPAVLARAAEFGLVSAPGVLTPTEALTAARSGASALKFFPAGVLGPAGVQAIRAVLPPGLECIAVGGVGAEDFGAYLRAGVRSFGLGGALYRPGDDAETVSRRARAIVAAYDRAVAG